MSTAQTQISATPNANDWIKKEKQVKRATSINIFF